MFICGENCGGRFTTFVLGESLYIRLITIQFIHLKNNPPQKTIKSLFCI